MTIGDGNWKGRIAMPNKEKVIEGLENLRETIRTATQYTFTSIGICAMSMKRIDNALSLLNEQQNEYNYLQKLYCELQDENALMKEQKVGEPKQGEWIYCEDASGQDGYKCSECGFFEPWYYDRENHNFITEYTYCPSCGKPMQEGR